MRKGYRKILRWILFPALLAGVGGVLWISRAEQPPVAEIESLRALLASDQVTEASFYYPEESRCVRHLYTVSLEKWRAENEKFITFRNYEEVRQTVSLCRKQAGNMLREAEDFRRNSREVLEQVRDSIRREMERLEPVFAVMPLTEPVKRQYARGKLLLNEADIAFRKADYRSSAQKTDEAARSVGEAYRTMLRKLEDYFTALPHWRREVNEAVLVSRRRKMPVVVIEKFPPRCRIYDEGKEIHTFPVEFGKNWMGNKRYEGDLATPEGHYRVVKKLQGRHTRYYKALLLDYPNGEDRERFEKGKKSGHLPAEARIGGNIEIHGCGGRQAYWTEGCIALNNRNMDVLYRQLRVGTPVLIIGSSLPLKEALQTYSLQ